MSNLPVESNNNLSISLPIFDDPQGAREIMEANMEGVDSSLVSLLTKVKVPSGGAEVWKVPQEDGKNLSVDKLTGVIIHQHKMNGYYASAYSGTNAPPDCASRDGITGHARENSGLEWAGQSKECATCPLNQYGSGEGGKGKACKNMLRIFLLQNDELFPTVVSVPPTSIGNHKKYMANLTSKHRAPYFGVVTGMALKEDRNDGGIVYSKIVFTAEEKLNPTQTKAVKAFADSMKSYLGAAPVEIENEFADTTDSFADDSFDNPPAPASTPSTPVVENAVEDDDAPF